MATPSLLNVKGNIKDGMVRARDEDAEIIVLTLQDRPPTPIVGHRPDHTFLKSWCLKPSLKSPGEICDMCFNGIKTHYQDKVCVMWSFLEKKSLKFDVNLIKRVKDQVQGQTHKQIMRQKADKVCQQTKQLCGSSTLLQLNFRLGV